MKKKKRKKRCEYCDQLVNNLRYGLCEECYVEYCEKQMIVESN